MIRRTPYTRVAWSVVAVASVASLGVLVSWSTTAGRMPLHSRETIGAFSGAPPITLPSSPSRPIYQYSVIPGGVYSRGEVISALATETLVRDHYADVSVSRLALKATSRPMLKYASYRKNATIYWTRKPVRLNAGEAFLYDGDVSIRARCGNRLSEVPRSPVSPDPGDEPAEFELDRPVGDGGPAVGRTWSTAVSAGDSSHRIGDRLVSLSAPAAPSSVSSHGETISGTHGGASVISGATAGFLGLAPSNSAGADRPGAPSLLVAATGSAPLPMSGNQADIFRQGNMPPALVTSPSGSPAGSGISVGTISVIIPGTNIASPLTPPLSNDREAPTPPVLPAAVKVTDEDHHTRPPVATPEPSTITLVLAGALSMVLWQRRRSAGRP